jgi:hypothetical protein
MKYNCKSFQYVAVGQTFNYLDGQRYEKVSDTHAKPFGGGKSVRLSKDFYCENVGKQK